MRNREGGTGRWVQRELLDFRHPGSSPKSANPLRATSNWPLFTKSEELANGCDSGHEQALAEPRDGQDLSKRACPEPWEGKMAAPNRNYEKNRVMKAKWSSRGGRRELSNLLFLGPEIPRGIWKMETASQWGSWRQVRLESWWRGRCWACKGGSHCPQQGHPDLSHEHLCNWRLVTQTVNQPWEQEQHEHRWWNCKFLPTPGLREVYVSYKNKEIWPS